MEITNEIVSQAMSCQTVDELLALAQANGIDLPIEEAEAFMQERFEGELADEELDNVSGGEAGCKRRSYDVQLFNTKEEVQYIFDIGQQVQAFIGAVIGNETATVRITERGVAETNGRYIDVYKYDRIGGSATNLGFGFQNRHRFEVPR